MPAITNRRIEPKEGADFWPSPTWSTKLLLMNEQLDGTIIEGCCGDGAMAKELANVYGDKVIASDLYDRGYGQTGVDVFDIKGPIGCFVTNPPYLLANDILEHALDISSNKVCLLLRLAFAEGIARYNRFFRYRPPTRVWVFSERLSMYKNGETMKSSGTTCYAWWVFDKNSTAQHTEMRWFQPGMKPKHG